MMEIRSRDFKERAVFSIHDANLQQALDRARDGFIGTRAARAAELPEFEQLREEAKNLKDHILGHLDHYLEKYEAAVLAAGGQVHWARDAAEARRIILDICRRRKAKTVCKGKSMVSEEIGLNEALIDEGMEVTETDLGEYIIQLAKEPPSHIIAPAVHKTKKQITELFARVHRRAPKDTVPDLVNEAREVLREKFFQADIGITGGNFLVAESGSSVIITNEGNGDLTQTLGKVHIVTSSIEKVVPTFDDLSLLLRLLARSATGQETESYTTISTGPRQPGDLDGPEEYHVVLVDNGRSKMLGGRFREMLRCIRCGACMNHCPVYGAVGGHAYGWVYPGPMGSVLTPLIKGLDNSYDLPNACTLNGRCGAVCPVKIPLPDLLRDLRYQQHKAALSPVRQRWALNAWRWVATRPTLYHFGEQLAARGLKLLSKKGRIQSLPMAGGWTDSRDLPAPSGKTFLEQWKNTRGPQ